MSAKIDEKTESPNEIDSVTHDKKTTTIPNTLPPTPPSKPNSSITNAIDDKLVKIVEEDKQPAKLKKVLRKSKKRKPEKSNSDNDEALLLTEEQLRAERKTLVKQLSCREQEIADLEQSLSALRASSQVTVEQLATSKSKLFESLNQNIRIRTELKMAQKCIEQETGEPLKVALANSAKSNWRGRAEQISLLQNKLSDLKRQLSSISNSSSTNGSDTCDPTILQVRQVEAKCRLELERTTNRLEAALAQTEEQRTKISAQRLRNTNLKEEIVELKAKIQKLTEATAQEDQRVNALNESMAQLNKKHEEDVHRLNGQIQNKQREIERLNNALSDSKTCLDECLSELTKKRKEITELNRTIDRTEQQLQDVCGDFLFNCRDLRKDEYMAILDVLQFEKKHLLIQVQTLNERLNEERVKTDNQSELIRKLNIKHCRDEVKFNEVVNKLESLQKRNSRTQRIADYVRHTTSTTNVAADKAGTGTSSAVSVVPESSAAAAGDAANSFQISFQIADLQNKLDLSNERIVLLESNLNTLRDEKMKDAELFRSILSKSKFALRDYLLERKQNELSCTTIIDHLATGDGVMINNITSNTTTPRTPKQQPQTNQ